jgi:hypothetical protein
VTQSTAKNPPATTPTAGAIAKKTAVNLITLLQTDFNYDLVKDIIDTMAMIKRAKKIKPLEKWRLIKDYQLTLLSYTFPKMKIVEDNSANTGGKGVVFHIQIGGTDQPADPRDAGHGTVRKDKKKGVSISIPTQKNNDGTYTVESTDYKDTDPTD